MNIKNLLLELDPGKENAAAVSRACMLAKHCQSHVHVLVYEKAPVAPIAGLVDPAMMSIAQENYEAEMKEWLKNALAEFDDAGIDFDVTRSDEQPRAAAVLDHANASGADLIIRVLGEHGRLKRLMLGSADWDLIRHATQPLWLVPSDARGISGANVMAAVDPMHPGDEDMNLDKQILNFANNLGKAVKGSLHVYHTYQLSPVTLPVATGVTLAQPEIQVNAELLESVESAHKHNLEKLIKGYELKNDQVHCLEGDAATEIGRIIDTHEIGIVVAGAISRSALERLFVGSTAEALLDAVSCDLILVRKEQ